MSEDKELERQLALAEYESCRSLLVTNIEIIERTETYAVGACAAVMAFTISLSDTNLVKLAPWLGVAIAILGYVRFFGIDRTIDIINNYLVEVENRHSVLGWTAHYRSQNRPKWLKRSRHAFWWVLIIITIGFSLIRLCSG